MQRVAPLRNTDVPEERRHHARSRLTALIYVELGPGNGGIIITLGTGGLSLHAAAKLNSEAELDLRFRLNPTEKPIEAAGRVAWLDPTRKEAGILFKDLPAEAERQIADWIAAQEQPVSVRQTQLDPQPKTAPRQQAPPPLSIEGAVQGSLVAERPESALWNLGFGIPRRVISESSQPDNLSSKRSDMQEAPSPSSTLSIEAAVPGNLVVERPENAPSSLSLGIPRQVISESSQPNNLSSAPSELQLAPFPSPPLVFPKPEERYERPSDKLLRAPAKRYKVVPESEKPATAPKEALSKDSAAISLTPSPAKAYEVLRGIEKPAPAANEIVPNDPQLSALIPSTTKIIEVARRAPQANDLPASELRQRRKLGMMVAACAVGILLLVTMVTITNEPPDRSNSSGESAEQSSSDATVAPANAPQTTSAATDQSAQNEPPADDPVANYDLLPILPTHQQASVPRDGDWGAHIEAMLGMDVPVKVNPLLTSLPVWTVQHSGYYYCVDNLNSEVPQQGALMLQGDALQSGYQPKLGEYCN